MYHLRKRQEVAVPAAALKRHGKKFSRAGQGADPGYIRRVKHHGLIDHDVLAGLKDSAGEIEVRAAWRRDDDEVQRGIAQKFIETSDSSNAGIARFRVMGSSLDNRN